MVLSKDYWTTNLRKMGENPYNYMVISVDHYQYADDKEKFEEGIYALDLCNMLVWGNELYKSMGKPKKLNVSIVFDAMKAFYTGESFSRKQLKEFFTTIQDTVELGKHLFKFNSHISETAGVRDGLEFAILGLPKEEQKKLGEEAMKELNTNYVPFLVDMMERRITVDKFLDKTQEFIDDVRKYTDRDNAA